MYRYFFEGFIQIVVSFNLMRTKIIFSCYRIKSIIVRKQGRHRYLSAWFQLWTSQWRTIKICRFCRNFLWWGELCSHMFWNNDHNIARSISLLLWQNFVNTYLFVIKYILKDKYKFSWLTWKFKLVNQEKC